MPDPEPVASSPAPGTAVQPGAAPTILALTPPSVMRDFVITSSRVYYVRATAARTATLRSLELPTGRDSEIGTFTRPLDLGLSLSPDGKYLLYSQLDHVGTSLMLAEHFR